MVFHVSCGELGLVESIYGWQVLDRVLARAAALLQDLRGSVLSGSAILAQNGVASEELLVFEPVASGAAGHAAETAARIARAIEEHLEAGLEAGGFAAMTPQLAFRVAQAPLKENPHFRFERVVYRALESARLQRAKREDRRQAGWGVELRRVIEERRIRTLWQPVVRLGTLEVVGHEVLSRATTIGPLEESGFLFSLSERLGLSRELDRVCRLSALGRLSGHPHGGRIFLNTRPLNMADPEWAGLTLKRGLQEAGLEPRDVVCEVPETARTEDGFFRGAAAVMREADYLREAAAALRGAGFSIALDEAGTGRSSLEVIRAMRPEYVKVHRSLVSGLDSSLLKQEVIATLASAAAETGGATVAVGIETRGELETLRRLGVPFGQGYLFAPPGSEPLAGIVQIGAAEAAR